MVHKVSDNDLANSSNHASSSSDTPATTTQQTQSQLVQAAVGSTLSTSTTPSPSSSSPSPKSAVSLANRTSGLMGWLKNKVVAAADHWGAYVISKVLGTGSTHIRNKDEKIAEAEAIMGGRLPDHLQYTALVRMLNFVLWPEIDKLLKENEDQGDSIKALVQCKEILKEIIEINLAQGFANLSEIVAPAPHSTRNHSSLVATRNHSSLVALILTLCNSNCINNRELSSIEEKFRQDRANFQRLTKELLPSFISKQKNLILQRLRDYVIVASDTSSASTLKSRERNARIIRELFSELAPAMPDDLRHDFMQKLENNPGNLDQFSEMLSKEIVNNLIQEYIHTSDYTRKDRIINSLLPGGGDPSSTVAFINCLPKMREYQEELQQRFENFAKEEILTKLFPNGADSLFLPDNIPSFLQSGAKWILYSKITTALSNFLMEMYEPLKNDPVRNAVWEAELRSKVGGLDLSLLMQTPAALLLGFTNNLIQTSPEAVGSIAEFLGSQLAPPHPKELEPSQPSATIRPNSQPSTSSSSSTVEETQSRTKAARKQQFLLAQLTQNQLAVWIVDSIRILLHSKDDNLQGCTKFIKEAFDNLTLALMAKGTELAFAGETPASFLSTSSSSSLPTISSCSSLGTPINEHLFFKELVDRITPQLQSILSNNKISDQFWNDLMKDLPLPQLAKNLLMPLIIKKTGEFLKSLSFSSISATGATGNSQLKMRKAQLLDYEGGKEINEILKKVAAEIVEEALESNLGLITEFGLDDKIEEWMDIYLPGVKRDDDLKRWFSNNVSALGNNAEGSSRLIRLLKKEIRTVLRDAVINTIEMTYAHSSEKFAAQLLSKIHVAFERAFVNYDQSTRQQIMHGQEIQADIRKMESRIVKFNRQNAHIKKQISEKVGQLTPDQRTTLEKLRKAKLSCNRGNNSIAHLRKAFENTIAKLNIASPNAPWTIDQLRSIHRTSLLKRITPDVLLNPNRKGDLISNVNNNILRFNRRIKRHHESSHPETNLQDLERDLQDLEREQMLARILEMPADQLQLLSEGLNLIATLNNAEDEMRILRRKLRTCERNCARINSKTKMKNRGIWQSLSSMQNILLDNRQNIADFNREIEEKNKELDLLLPVFRDLSRELTTLLGLDEKEKLKLPELLRDKIWPLIESAKEGSIARLLFMHITPLILPIFDIPQNRQRLQELAHGDAFLNHLSHTFAERVIARIPDFITSYKPFAKELLELMGIEEPHLEAIQRMEKSLQDTLIRSGRNGLTASMLEPLVEGYFAKTEKQIAEEEGSKISDELMSLTADSSFRQFDQIETKRSIQQIFTNQDEAQKALKKMRRKDSSSSTPHHIPPELSRICQELQHITTIPGFFQFTQEAVGDILRRASAPTDPLSKRDQKKLDNKARALTKALNQFLLSRGKVDLTPQVLIDTYTAQLDEGQPPVARRQKTSIITAMQNSHFVQRIKNVAITPEEIAENINDAIPGARELHTLIAPELQAAIVGEDPAFRANRGMIQKYAEGMLLRIFIKIAEANQVVGQDTLTVLTNKLRNLIPLIPNLANKTPEEIVHDAIDKLIRDIIGVKGKKDFKGIPVPLQQMAYSKLKEILYQHMTPYLLPIVELSQNRAQLDQLAESPFLGNLSEAICQKLVDWLPTKMTPEEIVALVKEKGLPNMDESLQQVMVDQMGTLLHERADVMTNTSGLAKDYLHSILVKFLLRITVKNPAQDGKDSFTLATENLCILANRYRTNTQSNDNSTAEFIDEIMRDIFAIDSPDAFAGLPDPLKLKLYGLIKKLLKPYIIPIVKSNQTKDELEKVSGSEFLEYLSQAISRDVISKLPKKLTPENVAEMAREILPNMDARLQQDLIALVQTHLTNKSEAYRNLSRVLAGWIDGVISKVLLRVAEKNPAVEGKDSLIIATEKLLDIATKKYQAARTRPIEDVAEELEQEIMRDVFNITSHRDFEGLPRFLQHIVYDKIKGQLAGNLIRLEAIRQKLQSDDPEVKKARVGLKKFDPKK
ncbi:MAG: hypothetical protein ACHQUC_06115, partial [Chlamydiales bacterium]